MIFIKNLNMSDNSRSTMHLLSQSAYWRLSKILVEKLGLLKAYVLSVFIDRSSYYIESKQDNDGWFFFKREDQKKVLQISSTHQRTILSEFITQGFLLVKQEGMPKKNYYKINASKVQQFINDSLIEKSNQNDNYSE